MTSQISKIIHIDMDAFYASIEQRDNPSYRNKPLVVGGDPASRSVVCTASYEARKFGIHSAMPCSYAKKLCPQAIFIPPNIKKYKEVSLLLRKIFNEVTDVVEPLSLDEAYLDVTHNKFNEESATLLAHYIRSRIKAQLNLTASAGISSMKFMAKIASDIDKPNGVTTILPDQIFSYISSLPVRKLWGVGSVTEKKLNDLSIFLVKDIRSYPVTFFIDHFGKQGQFLYDLAFGRDDRSVGEGVKSRSMAKESTFSADIISFKEKKEKIRLFASLLSIDLEKQGLMMKTITVKAKFIDFVSKTKSKTLLVYTNDSGVMIDVALDLLSQIPDVRENPIRLLGISVRNFEGESLGEDVDQLNFSFMENSITCK